MEVRFLGTGTPYPDSRRCGSGTAVVDPGRSWVLVDCGRGVTQRAIEAGLDLRTLAAVLLTHHHSDHVSDLATLVITRFVAGAPTPLRIVAPVGPTSRFAESCLDPFEDQAFHSQRRAGIAERPSIEVASFAAPTEPTRVFDDGGWEVRSATVEHPPMEAAVGYRIELGGTVVAVSGDTVVCDGVRALAAEADLLVHEALRSDRVDAEALAWNASARSVGQLAVDARVGALALTHLLPPPTGEEDVTRFAEEAREGGFTGAIHVPSDLDRLELSEPSLSP
ncbi:MAG: MBL fold metallo-hydrolase [Actinomycetota bacterium]|nr:MBL fold metallo-hydrolase [Actinomycetota bacterium]